MYNEVVTRYAAIFGLLFQSLVLLCCGRLMPVAIATGHPDSCCTEQPSSECCCCSGDEHSVAADGGNGQISPAVTTAMSQRCERACDCPVTIDSPRAPAKPVRHASLEKLRANLAMQGSPLVLPPPTVGLKPASTHVAAGPPNEYGRLACERFCRWTI